ncbi:MAG: flavoprotein [Streptosporangiaceae bacterium]|jgi:phosphopantothenoylcysteine decarboxylase|nr:flavoprotein [Streptosporangiaceae bacterium]
MTGARRVAYVIACSAPPVLDLSRLVELLNERDWDPYVILTPTAATWVDVDALAEITGHPVRVEPRLPDEPNPLPPADVVIAAPLTFNTLNKWAAGINDTLALGLLNEALGLGLAIIAAPCIKEVLRRHPAYPWSVDRLRSAGVTILNSDQVVVSAATGPMLDWSLVLPS